MHIAIASIGKLNPSDPQELAALATICCERNEHHIFLSLTEPSASSDDLPDCRAASEDSLIPAVLVRSGLCTADRQTQIKYVQRVLGLVDEQKAASMLDNTSIPLMLDVDNMKSLTQMQDAVSGVVAAALNCQYHMDQCYGEGGSVSDWVSRMVLDVYRLGCTTSSVTPQVLELVSLFAIHKLRIRVLFAALSDADKTKATGIKLAKFDWSVTFCVS
jgi:hypothetical protein